MRFALTFLTLLVTTAAFAQPEDSYKLEARGEHYSIAINVHGSGAARTRTYDATVTDLSTNTVAWSPRLQGDGSTLKDSAEKDGLGFELSVLIYPNALSALLTVKRGSERIESLDAGWRGPTHQLELIATDVYIVKREVAPPRIIKRIEPRYPYEALANRVQGIVIVEVIIDKKGDVQGVLVLKEIGAGVSEAAVAAVKQWKFDPAKWKGVPVDCVYNFTVNFKLMKSNS